MTAAPSKAITRLPRHQTTLVDRTRAAATTSVSSHVPESYKPEKAKRATQGMTALGAAAARHSKATPSRVMTGRPAALRARYSSSRRLP